MITGYDTAAGTAFVKINHSVGVDSLDSAWTIVTAGVPGSGTGGSWVDGSGTTMTANRVGIGGNATADALSVNGTLAVTSKVRFPDNSLQATAYVPGSLPSFSNLSDSMKTLRTLNTAFAIKNRHPAKTHDRVRQPF